MVLTPYPGIVKEEVEDEGRGKSAMTYNYFLGYNNVVSDLCFPAFLGYN